MKGFYSPQGNKEIITKTGRSFKKGYDMHRFRSINEIQDGDMEDLTFTWNRLPDLPVPLGVNLVPVHKFPMETHVDRDPEEQTES